MFNVKRKAETAVRARVVKFERRRAKERKTIITDWRKELVQFENQAIRAELQTAHKNMIEDWRLGPLRPNRAVGNRLEKYGALPKEFMGKPRIPNHLQIPEEKIPFRPGDRVVILRGPERGKIGRVKTFYRQRNEVEVDGMNLVWIEGETLATPGTKPEPRKEISLPYSYTDVRLVVKWRDPRDGNDKDAIVSNIEFRKADPNDESRDPIDPYTGAQRYDRYVAGTEIKIELPEDELKKEREAKGAPYETDTASSVVEGPRVFEYNLLSAPVPDGLIDELRNKYSKMRTRHDPEWLEKMERLDEERLAKKRIPEHLKTPTQVLRELRQKQKQEEEKANPKILTDDVLAKIGEMVLENAPDAPVRYYEAQKVRRFV